MNIFLDAYLDNNIGDDLMVFLFADYFKEDKIFLCADNSVVKNTFKRSENIECVGMERKNDILEICDAYVSLGGSIFNNLNNIKGILRRIEKIRNLKKMKRRNAKIATVGCNLGPYKSKKGILMTKKELKYNDLVTVRDEYSYNLIQKYNMNKNFILADDIVFQYKYKKENFAFNKKEETKILGISAYRSSKNKSTNYNNYKVIANIAETFLDKNVNYSINIFCFDSEDENDISAAYHIKSLIGEGANIRIIPYIGNVTEFLRQYQKCDRFIAIRFHAAILCEVFDIPYLPLSYSTKLNNYMANRNTDKKIFMLNDHFQNYDYETIVNESNFNLLLDNTTSDKSSHHFKTLKRLLYEK